MIEFSALRPSALNSVELSMPSARSAGPFQIRLPRMTALSSQREGEGILRVMAGGVMAAWTEK